MNNTKKTISVDFDGVIHEFSKGWMDGSVYSNPVEGSKKNIELLMDKGYEIVICTSRQKLNEIKKWLKKNNFPELKVTNKKVPALAYIDDRGIRFTNWEDIVKYFI